MSEKQFGSDWSDMPVLHPFSSQSDTEHLQTLQPISPVERIEKAVFGARAEAVKAAIAMCGREDFQHEVVDLMIDFVSSFHATDEDIDEVLTVIKHVAGTEFDLDGGDGPVDPGSLANFEGAVRGAIQLKMTKLARRE